MNDQELEAWRYINTLLGGVALGMVIMSIWSEANRLEFALTALVFGLIFQKLCREVNQEMRERETKKVTKK